MGSRFSIKEHIFVGLGAVMILIAIVLAIDQRRFVRDADAADGRVIALNAGGSHPEIEFTTASGERIHYPQGGVIWGYEVGDRVRVLYRADEPLATATIDSIGAIYPFSVFGGGIGLGFIAIALGSSRWRKRSAIP